MIEYAVCSQEMDSQLFEILKFLLQVSGRWYRWGGGTGG